MGTIQGSTYMHDVTISVASQRQRQSTLELEKMKVNWSETRWSRGLAYLRDSSNYFFQRDQWPFQLDRPVILLA